MRPPVLCSVLLVILLPLAPALQQMLDISDLSNSQACSPNPGKPMSVRVTSVTSQSAMVLWNGLRLNDANDRYQVLYWEVSSTLYNSLKVEGGLNSTTLTSLSEFSRYWVQVRVSCNSSRFGPLSDRISFTTLRSEPTAHVSNLTATANYNGVPNLVRIHWNHIPHADFNGNAGGYLVYIYQLPDVQSPVIPPRQVNFPLNEDFVTLGSGQYSVTVVAFNAQGGQSKNLSESMTFNVEEGASGAGLDYPFVYIIVPGIIFVVVIIVINVIIFKKVHETRRRSVTYCKELPGNRGYTNAIPLQERRSPSSSLTPLGPTSPSIMVTQTSFVNRPLPLSPNSTGPSPTRQPRQQFVERDAQGAFGNGPPANFPAPKLPHPGPLPQLSEGSDTGFAPMHRTMTNQSETSVFSPTASIPPFAHPQQRTRACTTGGDGMPSPYEIPEHNGSTLSRADTNSVVRSVSASAVQHRNVGPPRGNFPPPPAHSPPPLTHSSMELRARMDSGESFLTSPVGQNTLPRTMGHQHSNAVAKPGPMKHIHSEGHFPIFEEKADDKMAYIRPLDSSVEASLHSGSGNGPSGVPHKPSLEAAPYPYHEELATNGSIVGADAFGNFSERTEEDPIPRAPPHNPTHHPRERSVRSHGRESLFSETSIELSVSSNSDREVSPAWDHRGATSDVGVGVLRRISPSPEGGRETVSEVGTGYKPHHVFKQV